MSARRRMPESWPLWVQLSAIIAGISLWRLAIAGIMPVTQDEAYYFSWAHALAWGYFDHPPGVAALGLGTLLEPASALAARVGTVLAAALTLAVLASLYRNSGIRSPGTLALALVLAAASFPGIAVGIVTTPDTVLALCWALVLHEAERALAGERRRWLSAGIATGLGLLGKYTMVLIGPVLLIAILRADPRALRSPWPYLGGFLALLVFAPNLVWNAGNDWLSLRFQLGHGFATDTGALIAAADGTRGAIEHSGPVTIPERLASLGGFLALQAGFWGLILPLLAALPWLVRRSRMESGETLRSHARSLLRAAVFFPLGFFALLSLTSDVEANWPVVYLLAAPALIAVPLMRLRAWVLAAAAGNLLLVSLYAGHAATGFLPLPDSQNRVLRETHGFRELAERTAELDAPVYADRYQTVAMLRFYRPGLNATQWPGLTRPSEYLRGVIAPRVNPTEVAGPFWLVTRRWGAPPIDGFVADSAAEGHRRLFDCAGRPLAEAREPPCRRPLHVWNLHRYLPAAD